jgi:hypothetical protein
MRSSRRRNLYIILRAPPKFGEREPFVWEDEQGCVSRFVSLGAFGGETTGKKQRVRLDSFCQGGEFIVWAYNSSSMHSAFLLIQWQTDLNLVRQMLPKIHSSKLPLGCSKCTLDVEGTGENYIFGNVQQPAKCSRIGKYPCKNAFAPFNPSL